VTAPQPGIPVVKVTVDRRRVPLGEVATFTLSPASVVLDPRFVVTLFFGDGGQQRVSQPRIVYLYKATGTYTYSILVKSGDPTIAKPPRVSLSANPTRVSTESPVTFTAQPSHSYPNLRYRFAFGDQNQTAWQSQPVATHAYQSAGKYLAYVDIGTMINGDVKPLGGSVRQAIEAMSPLRPVRVTLSANPMPVEKKRPATFVARVDTNEPNITYRFDFGDGSRPTSWQVTPRTTHAYSAAGNYPVRVEIQINRSQSGLQTASSNPLLMEVTATRPDDTPGVSLIAVPQSVPAGLPVFFRASSASADSNTRYRFRFGDGTSGDWKAKPEETHIYSLAGNYPAFVELGSVASGPVEALAASGRKEVRVEALSIPVTSPTPGPSPSPIETASPTGSPSPPNLSTSPSPSPSAPATPSPSPGETASPSPSISPTPNQTPSNGESNNWWKYLLAVLILFVGYQGWKALYAPRPTLVPKLDPGDSNMDARGGGLGINFQMELNQNVTDGQVAVNTDGGSLIKSERMGDD
jgi:hypothetical protein